MKGSIYHKKSSQREQATYTHRSGAVRALCGAGEKKKFSPKTTEEKNVAFGLHKCASRSGPIWCVLSIKNILTTSKLWVFLRSTSPAEEPRREIIKYCFVSAHPRDSFGFMFHIPQSNRSLASFFYNINFFFEEIFSFFFLSFSFVFFLFFDFCVIVFFYFVLLIDLIELYWKWAITNFATFRWFHIARRYRSFHFCLITFSVDFSFRKVRKTERKKKR